MKRDYFFQNVIMNLNNFWMGRGALLWNPMSEKVGAGTMNPATVLRVLGPEPFNVAYVEPSFRPDDGRFGDNPNRLQMHHQYQVILKPDPGNPQEIYLDSLTAIGIDRKKHDIRFVEDNWESPALGAWGLGWEVWLDGMEITQFTYFQQAGGIVLDPVSVEITYGLERIIMYLQGVKSVYDIRWNEQFTYGQLLHSQEVEYCHYGFTHADVGRLKTLFDLYAAEALAAIGKELPFAAHDYVLKCSHTFNLLDCRGAIGVTERARYFAKMREMARQVSHCYLEQRRKLDFPLLAKGDSVPEIALPTPLKMVVTEVADLVLEIGCEELPPADLDSAREKLGEALEGLFKKENITYAQMETHGTPRRLVAMVRGVAPLQESKIIEVKGPPLQGSKSPEGQWSPSVTGFLRKNGATEGDIIVQKDDKGREFIAVKKRTGGGATSEILARALPAVVEGLTFPKSMRWNHKNKSFSRPVRWLLALHGGEVIPFTAFGLQAGRTTRANRFLGGGMVTVPHCAEYLKILEQNQVQIRAETRRKIIEDSLQATANAFDGEVGSDPALLAEVTHLVEFPTPFVGSFDPDYLALPKEILIAVMKHHQRYFPLYRKGGTELLPHFLGFANGENLDIETIKAGNNGVIRARYEDARFFRKEDSAKSWDDFFANIRTLTFEAQLGSMKDKSARIEKIAARLTKALPLPGLNSNDVARAAELCKADLGSSMVAEMTSLQGIMGDYYARERGENATVGTAIREQYLPGGAEGSLPQTPVGIILSLADKIDSLMGLFGRKLAPTGSADPFGLRREAIGLNRILVGHRLRLDVAPFLQEIVGFYPIPIAQEDIEHLLQFLNGRLKIQLKDEGHPHDIVECALGATGYNPHPIAVAVSLLATLRQDSRWRDLFEQYARSHRLVRAHQRRETAQVHHFQSPEARSLLDGVRKFVDSTGSVLISAKEAPAALLTLIDPIRAFFDKTMVNCENMEQRASHYGLLQDIVSIASLLGDFSKLEGF